MASMQLDDAPVNGHWRRWAACAALSLGAHGLLLLGQEESRLIPTTDARGSPVISVSLTPAQEMPAASKMPVVTTESSTPKRQVAQKKSTPKSTVILADNESTQHFSQAPSTSVEIIGSAEATTVNDTASGPQDVAPHDRANTETSASRAEREQEQRNFLLGKVRSLLSQHFSYPLRARQRGWEGEVLLGFQVDENGKLNKVHLARSSGYSLLDKSALAALLRVKDISILETRPHGPMELQLPVIYQLREG